MVFSLKNKFVEFPWKVWYVSLHLSTFTILYLLVVRVLLVVLFASGCSFQERSEAQTYEDDRGLGGCSFVVKKMDLAMRMLPARFP